jgi:hypothetical protein
MDDMQRSISQVPSLYNINKKCTDFHSGDSNVYLRYMIKPIQKAPKAFAERYNRIIDGEEVIDTVAKLKEFWLFAIEQGKPHPEMRKYIGHCAYGVPTSQLVKSVIFSEYHLHEAYIELAYFSPSSSKNTDLLLHNELWQNIADHILEVDETALDQKIKMIKATPQLSPEDAEKLAKSFMTKKYSDGR